MTYREYLNSDDVLIKDSSSSFFENLKRQGFFEYSRIQMYEPNSGFRYLMDAGDLTEDDEIFIDDPDAYIIDHPDAYIKNLRESPAFPEEEDQEDKDPFFVKKLRALQSELVVKLSFNDNAVDSIDSVFSMIYTVFKHTLEPDYYRYSDVLVDVNRSYIEQLTGTIHCLYFLNLLAFKDKQYAIDELNSYKESFAGYVNSLPFENMS